MNTTRRRVQNLLLNIQDSLGNSQFPVAVVLEKDLTEFAEPIQWLFSKYPNLRIFTSNQEESSILDMGYRLDVTKKEDTDVDQE